MWDELRVFQDGVYVGLTDDSRGSNRNTVRWQLSGCWVVDDGVFRLFGFVGILLIVQSSISANELWICGKVSVPPFCQGSTWLLFLSWYQIKSSSPTETQQNQSNGVRREQSTGSLREKTEDTSAIINQQRAGNDG